MASLTCNVEKFTKLLQKATLNYTIPTVQLGFYPNKVKTGMRSVADDAFIILDKENDVVSGVPDEIEMNFFEPQKFVTKMITLLDSEEVRLNAREKGVTFLDGKVQIRVQYCHPDLVRTFPVEDNIIKELDFDAELIFNEEVVSTFNKILKLPKNLYKIYFSTEDGELLFEATDKQDPNSNALKFNTGVEVEKDFSICVDMTNFINVLTVIRENVDSFKIFIKYVDEQEAGMVLFKSDDVGEKYLLMSKTE